MSPELNQLLIDVITGVVWCAAIGTVIGLVIVVVSLWWGE